VEVTLTFRTAVLAVVHNAQTRAVDGSGVVLPAWTSCAGLPRLTLVHLASPATSGTVWEDAAVQAAARTAAVLRPHQEMLRLEVFEASGSELVLSTPPNVRVLWGRSPGAEPEGEPTAAEKTERLLSIVRQHGSLGGDSPREYDVRRRDSKR
jgi:hypothetical protein